MVEFIKPTSDDFWENLRAKAQETKEPTRSEAMATVQRFQLAKISHKWQKELYESG